jgi:hypothetical protein
MRGLWVPPDLPTGLIVTAILSVATIQVKWPAGLIGYQSTDQTKDRTMPCTRMAIPLRYIATGEGYLVVEWILF